VHDVLCHAGPEAALRSTFGDTLTGAIASIVVRNWGALITLVGLMLIYGAYDPPGRRFILPVAGLSKLVFIALALSHGGQYLRYQAGIAVAVDAAAVLLFACYLIAGRPRADTAA
jgi:hypothetical protein